MVTYQCFDEMNMIIYFRYHLTDYLCLITDYLCLITENMYCLPDQRQADGVQMNDAVQCSHTHSLFIMKSNIVKL